MYYRRRQILKSFLSSIASLEALKYLGFNLFAGPKIGRESLSKLIEHTHLSDGFDLGDEWEGLNPGYWRIHNGVLRRATSAVGDRANNTGFPFHYENKPAPQQELTRNYDPSLPLGILWNRYWNLSGEYSLSIKATVKGLSPVSPQGEDNPSWSMYQAGYGLFGLSFGSKTQFESFYPSQESSPLFIIKEDGTYGLMRFTKWDPEPINKKTIRQSSALNLGDQISLNIRVSQGMVRAQLSINDIAKPFLKWHAKKHETEGFFGLAARGYLDITIEDIAINPVLNKKLHAPLNDCHVCYPLGDTLKKTDKGWKVRYMALFRSRGQKAEIRITDRPDPKDGWEIVPVAGSAAIISNDFRRNTAAIDVILPQSPNNKTLYYTIWKDGVNVTADPRIGTDSVGSGTGLVGGVPLNGSYVGRLPKLEAPYKICGLSCHAIHTSSKADLPDSGSGDCAPRTQAVPSSTCNISQAFYVHDQPCYGAFKNLEDFNYQIMLWEDDVWYLELLFYPPSTDDAYKIITTTIAGPTTRWQMMRHWNVLNPGDHDHGMDDVKGPEQLLIRTRSGLGQDPTYMVRNFQIVSHLMTGKENPSGRDNPKRWRKWKMPDHDFTLLIMDSRLWRTSQDPAIWTDQGWGHNRELYSRTDPTRVLLGEEQFAWLHQQLKTDSSPLICLTGINVLHTIWGGHTGTAWTDKLITRDRVSADYAGWVKAGVDRILELLSARSGVISIYGDVHAGMILRNRDKRIYECSFGPIGRWGSRSLIKNFGPRMSDYDNRPIEIIALYHHKYRNADLDLQKTIQYWNVLEAEFDPSKQDPEIALNIRNIKDSKTAKPQGGGSVIIKASETGCTPTALLPNLKTLKNADLLFLTKDNLPIRGARSMEDGSTSVTALAGVAPGEHIILLSTKNGKTKSQLIKTQPLL